MASTYNPKLSDSVKPTDEKLSKAQQNQWSNVVMARLTEKLKSNSVNKIIWGEEGKKKG